MGKGSQNPEAVSLLDGSKVMKIHLVKTNPHVEYSESQTKRLQKLWKTSSHYHDLVDSGEQADLIVVADIAGPNWFKDLRENVLVNRYPKKSFAISDSDFPFPLLHGVYTSATYHLAFRSRFRSAGYNLYPEKYMNPSIQSHSGDAFLHDKKYLGSFMGRDSAPVRLKIFNLNGLEDLYIYDTSHEFAAFGESPQDKNLWQNRYLSIMDSSKYAICPRGVGPASLRLFESMKLGVAPILLSDDWILPKGPDWSSFALMLKEGDAHRLHEILKSHEHEYAERGQKARLAYETYFSEESYFNYLIDQIIEIKKSQILPEALFWSCRNIIVGYWKLKSRISGR
jgi:hypothetical protein